MTSSTIGAGSRISRELPRAQRPQKNQACCSSCNSQLCSSYLVGLMACLLVVGGIFLAFQRWDYMWLAVTGVGIILVFVGAMLHYCGSQSPKNRPSENKRPSRLHLEVGQNEHLLSTNAANLNGTFSVSQLSLNMLPPYFPSYEGLTVTHQPGGGSPTTPSTLPGCGGISPIMQINGLSFLLLPIGETTMNPDGSVAFDAQSLIASKLSGGESMLQIPQEQVQSVNEQRRGFVLIKPQDFGTASMCQSNNPPTTNGLITSGQQPMIAKSLAPPVQAPTSANPVPTSNDTLDSLVELNTVSIDSIEESEPLYQVPRSLIPENVSVTIEPTTICDTSETTAGTTDTEPVTDNVVAVQLCDITNNNGESSLEMPAVNNSNIIDAAIISDGREISRANTPEPEDEISDSICPPSYDEVAVNRRLGMPRFAYETM